MIPYSRQHIDKDDIDSVIQVLKSNFLTQGPTVRKFEKKITSILKCKEAIAVNSATSALHIACLALNVLKDDIVWTTPNSFVASANCALYCNAKIDFVDIDKYSLNISIHELEKKLKNSKKKKLPKVLIYVHLAGNPTEQKKIYQLSKKYKFKIIEDASHAFGASHKGELIGSCKWSHISIFSFHPVKIITSAEGGVATTNNLNYAKKMRLLSSHGITKNNKEFIIKKAPPWHYEQKYLGFNYRMSDIHASLGLSQINKYKKFNNLRNKLVKKYIDNLKDQNVSFQTINKDSISSYHLFIIIFSEESINIKVHKRLKKFNYLSNVHYQPIHLQPYYKKLGFKEGDFPNAEKYPKYSLSIPLFPKLSLKHVNKISNIIKTTIS